MEDPFVCRQDSDIRWLLSKQSSSNSSNSTGRTYYSIKVIKDEAMWRRVIAASMSIANYSHAS